MQPLLKKVCKITKPRPFDLFCGVLYLLKMACQWRTVTSGHPKRETVYPYFAKWKKPDSNDVIALERVLKNRVSAARILAGRNKYPSLITVGTKSVNNIDTAGEKNYDTGAAGLTA